MNESPKGCGCGCFWIVAFILWPIGLYLLIKKINKQRGKGTSTGMTMLVVGILFVIGALAMIGEDFGAVITYLIIGFLLLSFGRKKWQKERRYIDFIENRQIYSTDQIASELGMPLSVVNNDIRKMVKNGYFQYTPITNSLFASNPMVEEEQQLPVEMNLVLCESCGARNKIPKGQIDNCQYCGTYIS